MTTTRGGGGLKESRAYLGGAVWAAEEECLRERSVSWAAVHDRVVSHRVAESRRPPRQGRPGEQSRKSKRGKGRGGIPCATHLPTLRATTVARCAMLDRA